MSRWSTLVVLALAGCSGDPAADKTDITGETDADTDTDTDSDSDSDTYGDSGTTGPVGTASLSGTVTLGGNPVAARDIRFCRGTLCRYGETEADGTYAFVAIPSEWHSLEVVSDEGSMTAFVPIAFADDQVRTVDLVMQPATSTPLPANPAPLALAPGLEVTAGRGDVEPGFGDPPTALTAAFVPDAERPPVEGVSGAVLGVWYVGPFDNHAVDPAGVPARFDTAGLSAPPVEGASLRVYVGSYTESAWLDQGLVTVGADGWTTATTFPVLSTVILVAE